MKVEEYEITFSSGSDQSLKFSLLLLYKYLQCCTNIIIIICKYLSLLFGFILTGNIAFT